MSQPGELFHLQREVCFQLTRVLDNMRSDNNNNNNNNNKPPLHPHPQKISYICSNICHFQNVIGWPQCPSVSHFILCPPLAAPLCPPQLSLARLPRAFPPTPPIASICNWHRPHSPLLTPDIGYRPFQANFHPIMGEQPLECTFF